MDKSDIETMLERKWVDFSIPRNLLIRDVEDNFLQARKFRLYWDLSNSEYNETFSMFLKLAKSNNNKLNDLDALSLAETVYLNWKKVYEKMIIDFYLFNIEKIEEICEMVDIEKAKPEIYNIIKNIPKWLDKYLNIVAKDNLDLSSFFEENEKELIKK